MKKLQKLTTILLLTICAIFPIAAAGQTESQTPAVTEEITADSSERTVTVTDMSGDTVTIDGEIKKIINLWPSATSSFFVIGAGDLLTGLAVNTPAVINSWTQLLYPGSTDIPAFGGISPSIEEIVNMDPDLVIVHPMTIKSGYAQQIRDIGIPAINIYFRDYESMTKAYTILGEVLGGEYQEKLIDWNAALDSRLSKIRELTEHISNEDRPVVYYTTGSAEKLTETMEANSIFSDWVESAGGYYAGRLMGENVRETTAEEVFKINPDIIICGGVNQHVAKHALETKTGWKELDAVKNNRIYTNPYGCFAWDRFGLESLLQIHYALYMIQPEIAAAAGITKDSLIDDVTDFYNTYTNFSLSRTQAENMLNGLQPDGTVEIPVQ
ncbi:MAG: ABC transporter substrate-binding protein [Spirochaetales bacterium]|uniref:ABC transporter substrate-binding protein n=1 Tax=Candidatus Thalassospirochaeta sargassi TaxID=3119039 RepID=A0AAJ1IG26_9SPIO|nr:ABC transporter substrate-binding protein [Spirochaetales bacterium]